MTTIHRIQPGITDKTVEIAPYITGRVPFKLFYLVPRSVLDSFMGTLTYSAATPINLGQHVAWADLRVDTRSEGTPQNVVARSTEERDPEQPVPSRTLLGGVVADLHRTTDPWWAVVPIPRTNLAPKGLADHIRTFHSSFKKNRQFYDARTFGSVGQHPYEQSDEVMSGVSRAARHPIHLDYHSGVRPSWAVNRPSRRDVLARVPFPGVRVRTPAGVFEDICMVCPNYLAKLNDKCWFGSKACDDILPVIGVDGFFAKLREFDELDELDQSHQPPTHLTGIINVESQPGKASLLRVYATHRDVDPRRDH